MQYPFTQPVLRSRFRCRFLIGPNSPKASMMSSSWHSWCTLVIITRQPSTLFSGRPLPFRLPFSNGFSCLSSMTLSFCLSIQYIYYCMEEEKSLSLKERYEAKIEGIRGGSHIQEIVKKASALLKMSDKDQLRRIYINLGKMQFVELLQNTVEQFLSKKEDNKRLAIHNIFVKVVRQSMLRGEAKAEVIVNKAQGGATLMGRTKKIRKDKKRVQVKVKKASRQSVKEIQRRSGSANVFASLAGEESMDEEQ